VSPKKKKEKRESPVALVPRPPGAGKRRRIFLISNEERGGRRPKHFLGTRRYEKREGEARTRFFSGKGRKGGGGGGKKLEILGARGFGKKKRKEKDVCLRQVPARPWEGGKKKGGRGGRCCFRFSDTCWGWEEPEKGGPSCKLNEIQEGGKKKKKISRARRSVLGMLEGKGGGGDSDVQSHERGKRKKGGGVWPATRKLREK